MLMTCVISSNDIKSNNKYDLQLWILIRESLNTGTFIQSKILNKIYQKLKFQPTTILIP